MRTATNGWSLERHASEVLVAAENRQPQYTDLNVPVYLWICPRHRRDKGAQLPRWGAFKLRRSSQVL